MDQPFSDLSNKLTFKHQSKIPSSLETVFTWHTRKPAFGRLFPAYIQSKLIHIRGDFPNQEVYFKFFNFFIPIYWKAKHIDFKANSYFTDIQKKGPFKSWKHLHLFTETKDKLCNLTDNIEYSLPLPFITHKLFKHYFDKMLKKQFKFREKRLIQEFSILSKFDTKPLKILISGSSGLVGSELSAFLAAAGHQVTALKRKALNSSDSVLNYKTAEARNLEGFDVIIHLAGESVMGLWSAKKKQEIYNSRVLSTQFLCKQIQSLKQPPKILITASAIGYYPESSNGEAFDENAAMGESFLAEVVKDWENATNSLKNTSATRVVHARLGLVLHPKGGSLFPLNLFTKLGLAHSFGKGNNIWSWVSLDDVIYSFYHIIHSPEIVGPINIVAPEPVSQTETLQTLAKHLKRPYFLKIPRFLVKLLLGEMGQNLILANQRIKPQKLLDSRYLFLHRNLQECFDFYL